MSVDGVLSVDISSGLAKTLVSRSWISGGMPWRKNYVPIRAVPVRSSPGKNSVRRTVGRLKPVPPVLVVIGDAEVKNKRKQTEPTGDGTLPQSREVSMKRFTHTCENDSPSLSLRRWCGKPNRVMSILILSLLPVVAHAADGLPSSPPADRRAPDPGTIPEKMIEPGKAPTAPSKSDPGIQHVPEKLGDPRGVVKPPSLDPDISKNPEAAPPAQKGINPPPAGGTPPGKSGVR